MKDAVIEFWEDFASPHSYLAAARIKRLAAGSKIRQEWRPFLLGPICKQNDPSPSGIRARRSGATAGATCSGSVPPRAWPCACLQAIRATAFSLRAPRSLPSMKAGDPS